MVVPNQNGVSDCRDVGVVSRDMALLQVGQLEDLTQRLANRNQVAQPILRAYVTDKNFALEDRFEVWSKWCKKKVHGWIIHERDAGVIGKIVDDRAVEFDRYVSYDWAYFLEILYGWTELQERYGLTEDRLKEALIETNFGSFTMDW